MGIEAGSYTSYSRLAGHFRLAGDAAIGVYRLLGGQVARDCNLAVQFDLRSFGGDLAIFYCECGAAHLAFLRILLYDKGGIVANLRVCVHSLTKVTQNSKIEA